MDSIQKLLARLNRKERERVEEALKEVQDGNLDDLNVKKLKGESGLFRVRVGSTRIILTKEKDSMRVIAIDRRSESTYKDL